jgi:hypothetical protein
MVPFSLDCGADAENPFRQRALWGSTSPLEGGDPLPPGLAHPGRRPDADTFQFESQYDSAGSDPRLADFADVPMPMTPTKFGKLIADETEKWGKVIRAANIKAD